MNIFKKALTIGSGKLATELNAKIDSINSKEEAVSKLTDIEIKESFQKLKVDIDQTDKHDIEVEAFSLVREAAKRTINERHYDVQLFGGLVLLRNKIAEMKTGEGKTLVSTLPISLMSLYGKGVHVVTVNDYLAKRDAEWMKPIYNFLGLDVGLIYSNQEYQEKINAYKKDITYGTNNEFGFDYLRDNMAQNKEQLTQGELFYAVVDEVDSILVDEARTPLIISGVVEESTKWYQQFSKIVKSMKQDIHYEIDESKKQIHPTEEGIEFVESRLGISNMYENTETNFIHYLTASLRANAVYLKDVDYIVSEGQIKIVDEFTGRILEGRRYSDGLHQAIEAKNEMIISFDIDYFSEAFLHDSLSIEKKYSVITASKRLNESEDGRKLIRRIATNFFVLIIKFLFQTSMSDTHGMKGIRKSSCEKHIQKVVSTQDLFDTELLLRIERSGEKIYEVPAMVNEIRPSVSVIYSRIPRTIYSLIKLRIQLFKESLKTKNL